MDGREVVQNATASSRPGRKKSRLCRIPSDVVGGSVAPTQNYATASGLNSIQLLAFDTTSHAINTTTCTTFSAMCSSLDAR